MHDASEMPFGVAVDPLRLPAGCARAPTHTAICSLSPQLPQQPRQWHLCTNCGVVYKNECGGSVRVFLQLRSL